MDLSCEQTPRVSRELTNYVSLAQGYNTMEIRNMATEGSLKLLSLYTPPYLLKQMIQHTKWNQTGRNWTEMSPRDNSRRIGWSLLT